MKKRFGPLGKAILLILPLVVGVIGFVKAGNPFAQSLYKSLCLYGLGHDALPENFLVEIARWIAPLATMSGVVMGFSTLHDRLKIVLARSTGKSVAVFGPSERKAPLLKELGGYGIDIQNEFVKAHCYVLLSSEAKNFEFYQKYRSELSGHDVYIRCESSQRMWAADPRVHLFYPDAAAARLFWDNHPLSDKEKEKICDLSIVIIGFGSMGKELLLQGLRRNVFSPDQKIHYYIFGQEQGFLATHHQLHSIEDEVEFFSSPWYDELDILKNADRIILAEQKNQSYLIGEIRFAIPDKPIYIMSSWMESEFLSADSTDTIYCNWKKEILSMEYITNQSLKMFAYRIDPYVADKFDRMTDAEQASVIEFSRFIRDVYKDVDFSRFIRDAYKDVDISDREQVEKFLEIDHMHWSRELYLQNWQYGVPENGKMRDPQKRIHSMLKPFKEYSEEEKERSYYWFCETFKNSKLN